MKKYTTFLSLFLIISTAVGQDLNDSQDVISSNTGSIYAFDKSDRTIQGSPYVQSTFLPARVSAKSEQIFNLRYNAVLDEMEIESDNANNSTISKNVSGLTVTFLKGNKTYKSMTYFNEKDESVNGFLVQVTNANASVKLFLKERIKFVDRKPAKSSYQDAVPAKFDRLNDEYYLAKDNEIAKPLSSNKKDIAALFPDHKSEILKYISSEKLNVKKNDDLIKLIAYINLLK